MPQFLRLHATKKPRRAPRGQEIVYLDRADGVVRSVDDTGAANAFSGGGGGVTVSGSQSGSVAGVTEIKVAGAVTDLGAGVAGQGLVLQRLGPYHYVNVGTVDENIQTDTGLVLPAGAILLKAFALCITEPTTEDGDALAISLGSGGNYQSVVTYDLFQGLEGPLSIGAATLYNEQRAAVTAPASQGRSFICTANEGVYVNGYGFEDGAFDIYAIIASPAA